MPSYQCATENLPRAYGEPQLVGTIRSANDDFRVTEKLGFAPSGSGDHLYLYIEKSGMTTLQVREELARRYACAERDIGYAGLKDKFACTRQWFSVPSTQASQVAASAAIPAAAMRAAELPTDSTSDTETTDNGDAYWRVLESQRHPKKLTRGAHKGNIFRLRVVGVLAGEFAEAAWQSFSQRAELVRQTGVPNYFGDQRFGYRGMNVSRAVETFTRKRRVSKDKKGLYISALRSFLYNGLLGQRVAANNWAQYCAGDTLVLAGSNSFFTLDDKSADIEAVQQVNDRLARSDIHIGGLMFGADYAAPNRCHVGQRDVGQLDVSSTDADQLDMNKPDVDKLSADESNVDESNAPGAAGHEAHRYESRVAAQYPELLSCLNAVKSRPARRPLRMVPTGFEWDRQGADIVLDFELPAGSYATVFLRELLRFKDARSH